VAGDANAFRKASIELLRREVYTLRRTVGLVVKSTRSYKSPRRPQVPITTPAASPQSNGMSEAIMNTLRRDYLAGADLGTAAILLEQIPAWIADYNAVAPHSALGYQSPQQYRSSRSMGRSHVLAQTASRNGVHSKKLHNSPDWS
jgi:putative transposase